MITPSLSEKGPIINWLISKKIAKGINSANLILLGVTLVCFSIAFYVNVTGFDLMQNVQIYPTGNPDEIQNPAVQN